jgi:deoxyribonuclease-1
LAEPEISQVRAALVGVVTATLVLAACSGRGFPLFTKDLPWPAESQGCDVDAAPAIPDHYDERALANALTWVYRDHPEEAFCGCAFAANQSVDTTRCGYENAEDASPVIRWQAVVPPSRFGVYRTCWSEHEQQAQEDLSARRHCARTDPEFRAMEGDLYNYLPVIAALGEKRGDNTFGTIQGGTPREFGACAFGVQSVMGKSAIIEPPADVRGDIARIYFYMAARYGKGKDWKIKLSREQRLLFEKWNAEDPVDAWEKMRACRIQAIQGWENPFVK